MFFWLSCPLYLLAITLSKSCRRHSESFQSRNPKKNIASEFILRASVSCSSHLDILSHGTQVAVQQLLCKVLLPPSAALVWRNSSFILSQRLNYYIVDNLSIVVQALPRHILTILSVDKILLPWYVNWFINSFALSE